MKIDDTQIGDSLSWVRGYHCTSLLSVFSKPSLKLTMTSEQRNTRELHSFVYSGNKVNKRAPLARLITMSETRISDLSAAASHQVRTEEQVSLVGSVCGSCSIEMSYDKPAELLSRTSNASKYYSRQSKRTTSTLTFIPHTIRLVPPDFSQDIRRLEQHMKMSFIRLVLLLLIRILTTLPRVTMDTQSAAYARSTRHRSRRYVDSVGMSTL